MTRLEKYVSDVSLTTSVGLTLIEMVDQKQQREHCSQLHNL